MHVHAALQSMGSWEDPYYEGVVKVEASGQ